jgi:hypothetical protein
LSQLSEFCRQLKPSDWFVVSGQLLSAFLAIAGSIIGVVLGNRNARRVQRDEAMQQTERDRQAEALQITALLEALREEVAVTWNAYVLLVGQWVEDVRDSEALLPFWPCHGDYFTVFKSNAGKIGKIKSAQLRKALVEVYVSAQSHIDTYQAFNRIRDEWEHPPLGSYQEIVQLSDKALRPMRDYRPRVVRSHNTLKALVHECCNLLDTELGSSKTALYLINESVPPKAANVATQS